MRAKGRCAGALDPRHNVRWRRRALRSGAASATRQLSHAPVKRFSHEPNRCNQAHGSAPFPLASGSRSAQRYENACTAPTCPFLP
eukprot:3122093-Pleurochrysis_carterae.AAC.1